MTKKISLIFLIISGISFAQLPDRDELTKKFIQPETSNQAARDLIDNFQWGGIRTILRNLDNVSPAYRKSYAHVFRYMDLFRFRNDLNALLSEAKTPEEKSIYLMLLATFGRRLSPDVFEPYIADETLPLSTRLAAAAGIIKVQSPKNYDRFLSMANEAIIDPGTGQDDLAFADISRKNLGFFLTSKAKLEDKQVKPGAILVSIAMAENKDTEMFENILKLRKRKYIPAMIDRAIKVGGVDLLGIMAGHKTCKKHKGEIAKAQKMAEAVAQHRAKFTDQMEKEKVPTAAFVPWAGEGSSGVPFYRAGYALVKITADGDMTMVTEDNPFGGQTNLGDLIKGKVLPAYNDWEPIESYALVIAP